MSLLCSHKTPLPYLAFLIFAVYLFFLAALLLPPF